MKRVITLFIVVTVISMTCFSSNSVESLELPSNLFIAQSGPGKCTLASATMMLRSRMYRSGNNNWSSITESNVKNVAWADGLKHDFTYNIAGNTMTVKKMNCSGISLANLKVLLNQHPEGLVVYDKGIPHAVFVTGYSGDTIYCADTVKAYSGTNRSITSSWQGKKRGSQANILAHITGIWYITSYSIKRNSTIGLDIYNNNGWNKIDNYWYYVKDGKLMSGWQFVDQKWYYLDSTGVMQTGWIKYNNRWYYLDSSGVMQTGWLTYDSKSYYLNETGWMQTGWLKLEDDWYYFSSSGAMQTGWIKYNNRWYYLDSSGVMQTGWLELSEGKYYLNDEGIMITGNYNIENENYYFGSDGLLKEILVQ